MWMYRRRQNRDQDCMPRQQRVRQSGVYCQLSGAVFLDPGMARCSIPAYVQIYQRIEYPVPFQNVVRGGMMLAVQRRHEFRYLRRSVFLSSLSLVSRRQTRRFPPLFPSRIPTSGNRRRRRSTAESLLNGSFAGLVAAIRSSSKFSKFDSVRSEDLVCDYHCIISLVRLSLWCGFTNTIFLDCLLWVSARHITEFFPSSASASAKRQTQKCNI